jgi:hypothetical protein
LEQTVPAIDEGARLAAAHEHARYCAASLARAGMEYRPLLVPIFANAASALYASCLADAARDFERVVETHRWTGVGGSAAGVLAASRADDKEGEETRENQIAECGTREPSAGASARASRARPRGVVRQRRLARAQRAQALRPGVRQRLRPRRLRG